MDLSVSFDMLISRAASAADRKAKNEKQEEYLKEFWIFFGTAIGLTVLANGIRLAFSLLQSSAGPVKTSVDEKDSESQSQTVSSSPYSRFLSSVKTTLRIVLFRSTVPIGFNSVASLLELIFICGYLIAVFVWTLVDTRNLNTIFWEDRAALIGTTQVPLIVALAGKNNILSLLTGISHEKLNVFHRATGRTCFILLWMHGLARLVPGLPVIFSLSHAWVVAGVISLAGLSVLTILSIRPVRQACFEFFLLSHILAVLMFLVGGYYHLKKLDLEHYIWPGLLVWALDRVLRLGRTFWLNRARSSDQSLASVELISSDTVALTVRRKMTWKPSQHAYVILPTISGLITESHPFTIANIPQDGDENEVKFIIKARTGCTRRLWEYAAENESSSTMILIDGPYGIPPDLRSFSTCILIAGGSGISYTLPLLQDIVRRACKSNATAVRRVKFVWTVRQRETLTWVSKVIGETITPLPPSLQVAIDLHITSDSSPSSGASGSSASLSTEKSSDEINGGRILSGRPDISHIIEEEAAMASGPISVDVAGPHGLSNSVRCALKHGVASPLSAFKGKPQITLHVETFGMVNA